MIKHTLTAAALATVLAIPAYAQSSNPPAAQPPTTAQSAPAAPAEKTAPPINDKSSVTPSATPAPSPAQSAAADTKADKKQAGFVQNQDSSEWRSSKLVGTSVYGPDDKSIGTIDDLIVDEKGAIKAAVIGVGGFLGVGQKDVAVPFESLQIKRKQNSSSIEKITVTYTKDQLSNAPKFAYFQVQSNTTTGSGGGMASPGGMSKPASPAK
jgi:sporulation protein YlmC with PRC-barrel domain